jgi:hypothetical protein
VVTVGCSTAHGFGKDVEKAGEKIQEGTERTRIPRSGRRQDGWLTQGLCLGVLVPAATVLAFAFGGAILDGYGKGKAERAFAAAHPGLHCKSANWSTRRGHRLTPIITLEATNLTLEVGRVRFRALRGWRFFPKDLP